MQMNFLTKRKGSKLKMAKENQGVEKTTNELFEVALQHVCIKNGRQKK